MANQVLIICVILLLVAVGVAIYFGVFYKKCKDSQDAVKEIQSGMSSDIQTLQNISGGHQVPTCLLDGLAKKQLLSMALLSQCGNKKVKNDSNGKEICNKYLDQDQLEKSCGITPPPPIPPIPPAPNN